MSFQYISFVMGVNDMKKTKMSATWPTKEFVERLNHIAGENKTAFARNVGMPQPRVHLYVTGKRIPHASFLHALAVYGVDVNWLLTGTPGHSPHFRTAQRMIALLSGLPEPEKAEMNEIIEAIANIKRKRRK